MSYTVSDKNMLSALIEHIDLYKEHENAGATYKASPVLSKLRDAVITHLEHEQPHDEQTLTDSIFFLRYLTDNYTRMWRIAYAIDTSHKLAELEKELYLRFAVRCKEYEDDYYNALRLRKYYYPDAHDDISEIADVFLSEETKKSTEKRLSTFSVLKYDSIELSDKYLSVIDDVERRMSECNADKMPGIMQMQLRKKLLFEYGVIWKSPCELNPNVLFD